MNPAGLEPEQRQVIDLAALSEPARRLVKLYDDLSAGRPHSRGQLDDVLADLGALPPMPGRLGRDIRLLASGGVGQDRQVIVEAIERLRRVTTVQPTHVSRDSPRAWSRTRSKGRRYPTPGQIPLPGLNVQGAMKRNE